MRQQGFAYRRTGFFKSAKEKEGNVTIQDITQLYQSYRDDGFTFDEGMEACVGNFG